MPQRVLVLVQTVLILALVVVCGIQLGVSNSTRKRLKQMAHDTARLEDRLEVAVGWLRTSELVGLELVEIDGEPVKLLAYDLADDPELEVHGRLNFAADGTPPHPAYQVGRQHDLAFHPYQWSRNLLAATRHRRTAVGELLAEAESFTVRHRGADFLAHPFPFDLPRTPISGPRVYRLQDPWFSGLGQGWALGALLTLARTTGDPDHLARAERVFRSLTLLRRTPDQQEPWVAFVDDAQYLWFEEYPVPGDPQPRILNGHIAALEALYGWYRHTGDETARDLLRAGITTIHRYGPAFRRPGRRSSYGLGVPGLPDYGPERAVLQQRWLFRLTGEPAFQRLARQFAVDMRMRDR